MLFGSFRDAGIVFKPAFTGIDRRGGRARLRDLSFVDIGRVCRLIALSPGCAVLKWRVMLSFNPATTRAGRIAGRGDL